MRRQFLLLIVFLSGGLLACQPEGSLPVQEQINQAADNEVVATMTAVSQEVTIAGAEGLSIQATYATPVGLAPFPGVILLHMLGSNRQVWTDLGVTEALLAAGYAVLQVDLRGHGDTDGAPDWTLAEVDLTHIWAYFIDRDEVDQERTAVIGASIGANMALRLGAAEPAIKTAILLSPGLDYRGVTTSDAMRMFAARPTLLVASAEDSYAAESTVVLADLAAETAHLEVFQGAGHGTRMVEVESDLLPLMISWLHEHVP